MPHLNRRSFMVGTLGLAAGLATGVAFDPDSAKAGVPSPTATHQHFPVDDYGAVAGGTGDSAPGIRAALAAAAAWTSSSAANSASVIFSPGVYRIDRGSPSSWYALEIDGAARIGLYGDTTTLLVTTPYAGAISIARSDTMRVDGLIVDYETVPFTQGVITGVDPVAGTFDLALAAGYPALGDTALFPGAGYGTVRDAATGSMKRGGQITFSISYPTAPLTSGDWRLTVAPEHLGAIADLEVGDGFVTGFRGDWHGVAVYRCTDVTVAGVTIYASPGAAFIPSDCDGTIIRDSLVAIKPGSGRWISANADGVHNHGGRVGPRIFGNTFESLHDDAINVYSTSRTATAISGSVVTVSGGAMQAAAGDVVQVIDIATGTVRGESTITAVGGDSLSGGTISLTLSPLPAGTAPGDELFNRSFSAPGTDIQYNVFRELRGLGVRLRTSDSVVHGNQMFDLANWGIWVGNDPGYHEGPVGSVDAQITSNSVVRPCLDRAMLSWPPSAAGIMVENLRSDYDGGASKPHDAIVLADNYIEDPPRFGIFVGGASTVSVARNVIASTAGNPRTDAPTAMFGTRNSSGVTLDSLTVHEYAATPRDEVWIGSGVTGFTQV